MKLSTQQHRALAKLAGDRERWFTPFAVSASLATLNALVRRSLAEKRSRAGGEWLGPRFNAAYRITDLGWETYQHLLTQPVSQEVWEFAYAGKAADG